MPNLSSVDLHGLQQTALSQQDAVEQGHGHLKLAVGHAQTLASSWQGEASGHYQQALSNFHEHGTKLLQSLSDMHGLMLGTHSAFSNSHQETISQAQAASHAINVPTGLPGL